MLPVAIAFLLPYAESILSAVVIDRLVKFGRDTVWTTVKLDANRKVRDVFPEKIFGTKAEDALVLFVDRRISDFAAVLADGNHEKAILDLIVKGDVPGAWKLLTGLVVPAVTP